MSAATSRDQQLRRDVGASFAVDDYRHMLRNLASATRMEQIGGLDSDLGVMFRRFAAEDAAAAEERGLVRQGVVL